jgi:sugar lactone lactonase YvrE
MTRLLIVLVTAAAVTAGATGATNAAFPSRIDLPDGFQPEGIASVGDRFFVGSIPTGAVYSGSLRTGAGAILVPGQSGRAATGLEANRGRLWVSGAGTGSAYVYNAATGANITAYTLSTGGSFINDVAVTRNAAWFTDSFKPVLYRVPVGPNGEPGPAAGVTTVPLSGDYVHQPGFNLNGIAAKGDGSTLIVVQSGTGKLFTVTTAGVTDEIVLQNGESVPNGDGILLDNRTLYVVQNQRNVIAKIKLAGNLRSGRVLARLGNPGLDVPTTIADHGKRLYAVNARFGTPPTPTTDYWITQMRK